MAVGWVTGPVNRTHTVSACTQSEAAAVTLQPVLRGWRNAAQLSESLLYKQAVCNFANTCSAQKGLFFYTKFQASRVRMCLHKQVWMSAFALHILKCRWKRRAPACTQLGYIFLDVFKRLLFSFHLQRRLSKPQSMLGKWFAQFIYYFTLFYLKNSKRIGFLFSFPKASPKPKFILRWIFMPWREYSCRCLLHVQKRELVWQFFFGSLNFFVVEQSKYRDSWCTVGNLRPTKLWCKKAD